MKAKQIAGTRQRLEQAAGLAEVLDASWAAFDLIVAVCERRQPGSGELFPALAFAAAAAAEGRTILASAPSLPSGPVPAVHCDEDEPDIGAVADGLAGLAETLHDRLSRACAEAEVEPDVAACAQAAYQAAHVHKLLALEG